MKCKFIKWLLGILGFSSLTTSCETLGDIILQPAMYGCPSADYVINVEVEDIESGDKVEGIRVSAIDRQYRDVWDEETGRTQTEILTDTLARGFTSADGQITLQYTSFPREKHLIVAEDMDGEVNDNYSTVGVTVNVDNDDYKNPDNSGWYKGTATKDITIQLSKK